MLDDGAKQVSAWAFVLVAANVAIVYVFAAATKTEAGWASGAVLQQVTCFHADRPGGRAARPEIRPSCEPVRYILEVPVGAGTCA